MFLKDKINFDIDLSNIELFKNIYNKFFDLKKSKYNHDEFKKLSINEIVDNIYNNDNFYTLPHIIFYGKKNFEIIKFINLLLEKIYDKDVNNIKIVPYTIYGYGTTKTTINIKQSKYHIIIEPNSNGFDKYVIQEIIKQYAETNLLNLSKKKNKFRTVIINKIDDLSLIAQTSLRRTMEKHIDSCKFIFISEQISNIIEPLRSRCLSLRIPPLSEYDMFKILIELSIKNKLNIYPPLILLIIRESNNDIIKCIWNIELLYNEISYDENWKNIIKKIVEKMFLIIYNCDNKNNYINYFSKIRKYLYLIFITNIDAKYMIIEILELLLTLIDNIELKYKIIEITSVYEHRLKLGKRHIIHLEAYINSVIDIINNNKNIINGVNILQNISKNKYNKTLLDLL